MLGWCRVPLARAYAFGLYLDDDALLALQRLGIDGESTSSSAAQPSLVAQLLDAKQASPGDFGVAIVLVMARDIAGEHLAHGFRNSVLNRLKATQGASPGSRDLALASGAASARAAPAVPGTGAAPVAPAPSPPGPASGPLAELHTLAAAFDGRAFRTGDEVVFSWGRDGAVLASVRHCGVPAGDAASSAAAPAPLENLAKASDLRLARALFDVYCGDAAPVSARAWKTFNANLAGIRAVVTSDGASNFSSSGGVRVGHRAVDASAVEKVVRDEHGSRTK